MSILLVLAGHWFPLPRALQLNDAMAASGMAIFFTLSGFLITGLLLRDDRVIPFVIRRLMRILPLAWLAVAVLVAINKPMPEAVVANFLFYANLPPAKLLEGGHHLWSLGVELHFYMGVALLVGVTGRRGLYLLPLLAVAVTTLRIIDAEPISIVTWHRVDEILAGATLALVVHHKSRLSSWPKAPGWLCMALLLLLVASAHPQSGWLAYLRPYLASAAVGFSLFAAPQTMRMILESRPAAYVAQTSYAVYVIHGMLGATWLGGEQATKGVRYALRPVLVAATFTLAHVSTFYFENRWIALGKRLTARTKPSFDAHARS